MPVPHSMFSCDPSLHLLAASDTPDPHSTLQMSPDAAKSPAGQKGPASEPLLQICNKMRQELETPQPPLPSRLLSLGNC